MINIHIDAHVGALIETFDQCFANSYNTRLICGEDEPIYLPADEQCDFNRIIFAHGFFASALHEISHWCVAGDARRKLEDFGYWYKPDGRSEAEQAEFECVEVKPQALEWLLSQAAGQRFNFSADNLSSGLGASLAFQRNVLAQVHRYLTDGLPERPAQLVAALHQCYKTEPLSISQFSLR